MRIYIAGKVTNNENFIEDFQRKEHELKKDGFEVINPIVEQYIGVFTYDEWLEHGIWLLDKCEAIYMMKDWKESNGARIEYIYACVKGLMVLEEI